MVLPELTFYHFVAAGVALYIVRACLLVIARGWRHWRAKRHFNRYQSERDAYYNSSTGSRPNSERRTQTPYTRQAESLDYVKDKDTRIEDIAQPKGFWTKLVMNEKMNLIREIIRISNSANHKGYWQDRIEAQKNIEGKRQVGGDDSPQR